MPREAERRQGPVLILVSILASHGNEPVGALDSQRHKERHDEHEHGQPGLRPEALLEENVDRCKQRVERDHHHRHRQKAHCKEARPPGLVIKAVVGKAVGLSVEGQEALAFPQSLQPPQSSTPTSLSFCPVLAPKLNTNTHPGNASGDREEHEMTKRIEEGQLQQSSRANDVRPKLQSLQALFRSQARRLGRSLLALVNWSAQ
eukprot:scaffold10_cov257-Pinguiococcus_pyrenoidosus.AAC.34